MTWCDLVSSAPLGDTPCPWLATTPQYWALAIEHIWQDTQTISIVSERIGGRNGFSGAQGTKQVTRPLPQAHRYVLQEP
jgi:hypothetical protein